MISNNLMRSVGIRELTVAEAPAEKPWYKAGKSDIPVVSETRANAVRPLSEYTSVVEVRPEDYEKDGRSGTTGVRDVESHFSESQILDEAGRLQGNGLLRSVRQ